MGTRKVDIDDEDVGIRAYQLERGKAVERAVEKIRARLSDVWGQLEGADLEVLKWALGETWCLHRRQDWDDINFSMIKLIDVLKIIKIADQVINSERVGFQGFKEINTILSKL